jgi:hypothetical protein
MNTYGLPRREDMREWASGKAIAAGMWLRLGFFGGLGVCVVALSRLAEQHGRAWTSVGLALAGAALAVLSVRRAWVLLQDEASKADTVAHVATGGVPEPVTR